MSFIAFLKENRVILDGGMGTLLQAAGLKPGEHPELWCITRPEIVTGIHRAYFEAGSNLVCTNTFGANCLKFDDSTLREMIFAGVKCARDAAEGKEDRFVALDIGPTGKLLAPTGTLPFEEAVEIFAKTVRLGVEAGVDAILIETMTDSYETTAALLAAKENSDLPVLVTNAYGSDGKLMTGATPAAMVAMLEGMGVCALGANCSLGPKQLVGVAKELLEHASVPVILKPNAGLPAVREGKTVYDVTPEDFAEELAELVKAGVRLAGGCCGTTPAYIAALTEKTKALPVLPVTEKQFTTVSSYTHAVKFGEKPLLIGERINPTGKKRLKQALLEGDMNYLLEQGIAQAEAGAQLLDVNVGLPGIDEPAVLAEAVTALQGVTDLPLQIDTADGTAMEKALRLYNGKALVNSVCGKQESMDTVFPLVKKYGGTVIALTLDENGIPATAEGRVAIARKIIAEAEKYGIGKKDLVFDTLAMTVSADQNAPAVTLEAMARIKSELGCHTSLGVSNVSFGLPNREAVNGVFFTLALQKGLSAAIMNPLSAEMMKSYYSYLLLAGMDENCMGYVSNADHFAAVASAAPVAEKTAENGSELQKAVEKGLTQKAEELTAGLLDTREPLAIVEEELLPALDKVGKGFETGKLFLPQLLMSAEAAKAAFGKIKEKLPPGAGGKGPFVLATVQGDIHDIGKNIVGLLLENYGYTVIDLGKDVSPETVLEAVTTHHAPLAGLSALMTTTVPAMEATVKLLREKAPWCKIVVGGAVLTEDYARDIGADAYGKDAMATVRFAETV
ncbi:MAG: homocysteine S-methyltransferase family protein [Clostridia bacterium]|nr:homocysteine S-methyltransferase family protein [Clostridia bacterium]